VLTSGNPGSRIIGAIVVVAVYLSGSLKSIHSFYASPVGFGQYLAFFVV
jgi:hypothetical protein